MIKLTRINLVPFYLNADLIEHMEATPDTVISLTTGQKFVVTEPPETVIEQIIAFRRKVVLPAAAPVERAGQDQEG